MHLIFSSCRVPHAKMKMGNHTVDEVDGIRACFTSIELASLYGLILECVPFSGPAKDGLTSPGMDLSPSTLARGCYPTHATP
uniref:Uncharacterized protein n=1 Tax=Rhizophora mucronata TaxID=61149 RepID=A0A2P2N5W2_RHIMU